jgi:hypothetical protein
MAPLKIFYEPDTELLTLFWQAPSVEQLCQELEDDMVLIQDEATGQSLGLEMWAYQVGDRRLVTVDEEVEPNLLPDRSVRLRLCEAIDDLIRSSQKVDDLGLEFHYHQSAKKFVDAVL